MDAFHLLVRSERVYLDILQHELFTTAEGVSFDMDVHVAEFFEEFDPIWEFRGFVCQGKRTALTAYNPWVYDPLICEKKEGILHAISHVWSQAEGLVRSANYTLDFAVSKDLKLVYIVELNNFLPPLAGSCLFDIHSEHDKDILANGPFEFRTRDVPTTEADFVFTSTTERGTRTTIMQPAPPHLMLACRNIRRNLLREGQVPVTASPAASTTSRFAMCSLM